MDNLKMGNMVCWSKLCMERNEWVMSVAGIFALLLFALPIIYFIVL